MYRIMKYLHTYHIFKTLAFLFFIMSCNTNNEPFVDDEEDMANKNKLPNILLIIADDMGLDATPGYNIGTTKPNMPNLDNLMSTGIHFNNLWSNPTCSPTRSTIITGKYGFRTGVTKVDIPLQTSEISIQKYLDNNTNSTYNHAVIGKWHLSRDASHPNEMGINYYAGTLSGTVPSYTNWELNINGTTSSSNEYITTKLTNLAIDWLGNQTKPWFLWMAYNAPHTPFHLPPNELHTQGALAPDQNSIDNNPLPYYLAAIEAMDTEMGRLINSMSQEEKDNTIIIFIGDNGTPGKVAQAYPNRRSKGSVYQGGVNVPMVIAGKGVTRQNASEDALINTTDLFATIADIAETQTTEINDSKSFLPLLKGEAYTPREFIYTEAGKDDGTTDVTIRNSTHKYILFSNGNEALYNLNNDTFESVNLLNSNRLPLSDLDSAMKDELTAKLASL